MDNEERIQETRARLRHVYDMCNRTAAAYLDTCSEGDLEAHGQYCEEASNLEHVLARLLKAVA